jgi:hypothetical protein
MSGVTPETKKPPFLAVFYGGWGLGSNRTVMGSILLWEADEWKPRVNPLFLRMSFP